MVVHSQPLPVVSPPRLGELVILDPHPPDTMRHRASATLLVRGIRAHCAGQDLYVGAEQWVYFSTAQVRNRDFRAPDVYVVRGVEDRERQAWIVWKEGGVMPHLVVELFSEASPDADLREKRWVYEQVMRTPEYFVYDPVRSEPPRHYQLTDGGYTEVVPNAQGRFPTRVLGGWIGIWEGTYEGIEGRWLRLFDQDGEVVWTPEERTEQEMQRAQHEAHRAEHEAQRAEREAHRAEQEARRAEHEAHRAEHEAHRAEHEAQRAEHEAHRAEHEAHRAEHEAQRATALEAELAAYRARFGELPDEA